MISEIKIALAEAEEAGEAEEPNLDKINLSTAAAQQARKLARSRGKIIVVDFGVRTIITGIEFGVEERDGKLFWTQKVVIFVSLSI